MGLSSVSHLNILAWHRDSPTLCIICGVWTSLTDDCCSFFNSIGVALINTFRSVFEQLTTTGQRWRDPKNKHVTILFIENMWQSTYHYLNQQWLFETGAVVGYQYNEIISSFPEIGTLLEDPNWANSLSYVWCNSMGSSCSRLREYGFCELIENLFDERWRCREKYCAYKSFDWTPCVMLELEPQGPNV